MSPNTPSSPGPLSTPSAPTPAVKKTRWLLYGCGTLIALLLLIIGTVAVTLWWIQRPIKPVVLSPPEKAAVEAKLRVLDQGAPAAPRAPASNARPGVNSGSSGAELNPGQGNTYVPGGKILKLTDREINGLLNANTDLGKSVRLEFSQDAINAYLAVHIPEDFPIAAGKMFRARGRFRLSIGNGGEPYAILEDVSVLGLSLPKAWLGGVKGENLISDAMGRKGSPVFRGIKSLRVEPGALVLEVQD